MYRSILLVLACVLVPCVSSGQTKLLAPGIYIQNEHRIYVGIKHDEPQGASNNFYDPQSQQTGDLPSMEHLRSVCAVSENPQTLNLEQGKIGFSLYFTAMGRRPTVILVHGNDPETREMGFIIPFFACNGINVISYDQRGTGESAGSWRLNGPAQRANDIQAIYDAIRADSHVDANRIGIWAFSNGGWTAPLVCTRRQLAFMVLQSAPTESLIQNIDYEVEQTMARANDAKDVPKALALWHAFESSLDGKLPWSETKQLYDSSSSQPWFPHSLMPDLGISIPPPASDIPGLRRFLTFDPKPILLQVSSTPTLALYGTRDRNVDSRDSAANMKKYLQRAANRDVTVKIYPDAGHQLIVSESGYNGDATPPRRFSAGYPQIILRWLSDRGF